MHLNCMYSKHCPEPVNNLINFAVVGFPDLFWGPSTEHIPYQKVINFFEFKIFLFQSSGHTLTLKKFT